MKFATQAIHAGYAPDQETGAVMPPIYMSSTFALEAPGQSKQGFDYTRANNPNFVFLEKTIAALEGGAYATVFSSGIGALSAMASTLSQGDKVLALNGIYGGTYRLFNHILNRFGVEFINPLTFSMEEVEALLAARPKWLLFETPTNPLMNVFDISALTTLAKRYGVTTIVDNTFASPYCQNPLKYGADIVWHSTTKYIGGHSDVLGGVVVTNDQECKQRLDFARKTLGTNPSPFDCWLIMRGVKTLALRMEQHQKNALAIAHFLEKEPQVKKVYYPGLPSHADYTLAKKQMRAFNGMLSVEFNMETDKILQMLADFKYFTLAESLGGVESLISHPATMTHSILPAQERTVLGVSDKLVRISVGIEDIDDLIEDLSETLSKFK